jgi:hypothetical protein
MSINAEIQGLIRIKVLEYSLPRSGIGDQRSYAAREESEEDEYEEDDS